MLLALCTAGCPQPADHYLDGVGAGDAGLTADSAADVAQAVGPRVLGVRRVPLADVAEPRGLAVAGERIYTTDRLDDRLVALDRATGALVSATPLPDRGARALAWHEGALHIGYADRLYRRDGDDDALVVDALRNLTGLGATADGLVTGEGDKLYVRTGDRLAPVLEVGLPRPASQLARYGADYLMYLHSPRLDGETFAVRLEVLDALSPSRATLRGTIEVPADFGIVTGLAAEGDRLYLVGAGYGEDVGHLVEVTLAREPGR